MTNTILKKTPDRPIGMRSNYVHEPMNIHDEMHDYFIDNLYNNNRNYMRTFDLEQVSRILDYIGHFERK